jgi:hypothetical protein
MSTCTAQARTHIAVCASPATDNLLITLLRRASATFCSESEPSVRLTHLKYWTNVPLLPHVRPRATPVPRRGHPPPRAAVIATPIGYPLRPAAGVRPHERDHQAAANACLVGLYTATANSGSATRKCLSRGAAGHMASSPLTLVARRREPDGRDNRRRSRRSTYTRSRPGFATAT